MTDTPTPVPAASERTAWSLEKLNEWWNWSGPRPDLPVHTIGDLLALVDTLSARAEAAERELAEAKAMLARPKNFNNETLAQIVTVMKERAEAAEARAETARAEAWEYAATKLDLMARIASLKDHRDRFREAAAAVRALLTAPPPTAGAAKELRDRADFMHREGYRECDIAACNCGSWHGGHAANRLREISDIVPHNGILLRDAIAALVDLGHNGLRELLEAMLEYFEDRSDISGPNERVPNQEMRFAEEIKAALKELKR